MEKNAKKKINICYMFQCKKHLIDREKLPLINLKLKYIITNQKKNYTL